MIKYSDFECVKLETVAYTQAYSFHNGSILRYLLDAYGKRFDGEATALPVQERAPSDMPRILLTSEDNRFSLHLSPTRIDGFLIKVNDEKINAKEFYDWHISFLVGYLKEFQTSVNRMAGLSWHIAREERPEISLSQHFCRPELLLSDGPLDQLENFEIDSHKRSNYVRDIRVNRWMKCKSLHDQILNSVPENIIMIEQDINSLQEEQENRAFSEGDIHDFLSRLPETFESALSIHFPEESHA